MIRTLTAVTLVAAGMVTTAPAASSHQPYGGCQEAWQAPDSEAAAHCEVHGFVIRADSVVRDWKPCTHEDGSGMVRCIWDARHMGNGHGLSFKVRHGGTDRAVYVSMSHRRAHYLLHR